MFDLVSNWTSTATVADLASVYGLILTLIGLAWAIFNTMRSKAAAVRAEEAATKARDSIQYFETIAELSSVVQGLEEIRRLHREGAWTVLPDRYALVRKNLVAIRTIGPNLSEDKQVRIQDTVAHLSTMQSTVELALSNGEELESVSSAKWNEMLSQQIDDLFQMLVELKSDGSR